MSNRVEIVISADTGDTLLKLEATRVAVDELGSSGKRTGESMGSENDRSSLASGLKSVETHLGNLGGGGGLIGGALSGFGSLGVGVMRITQFAGDATQAFGSWIAGMSDGIPIVGDFGVALGGMIASLGEIMPILGPVIIGLAAFPVAAGLAAGAAAILGGVITTLAAVAAGFIPPLTLMGTLLGVLGGGFILAGIHALGAHKQFSQLHDIVTKIKTGFSDLIGTLAQRLAPAFTIIGQDVLHLVNYFERLSHMDLAAALRNFSTHGVQIISKMADDIGHLMARPFRLIVADSFSASSSVKNAFISRFSELRDYLFGHSESIFVNPIHQTFTTHIAGALQPILDWFNRQHFTSTGLRWLNELTTALQHSGAWHNLWNYVVSLAQAAGSIAGHAFAAAFEAELTSLPSAILHAITGPGPTYGTGGRLGTTKTNPTGKPITGPGIAGANLGARIAGAGGGIHFHINIHGGTFTDAASQRRAGAVIGQEVARRWMQQVGG